MSAASDTAVAWTAHKERSNLFALRVMRWIAVALGRRVARLVLHLVALYYLCFGGVAVRESSRYLERVLGRAPRWSERYRHVHHFAATILDRVYLLRQGFSDFEVSTSGVAHLDAVMSRGRGALLVGAHMGSFEALRALGSTRPGMRVAMVMYEDNARLINSALRAIAPDVQLNTIALGRLEAMLSLRQWLADGGVAGLLADRTLGAESERSTLVPLPFLGSPALFSDGPFRLAALLKRPLIFMAGLYLGGNRYELRFVEIADFSQGKPDVLAAMRRYVEVMESTCRESPYNWFNFFDFWAGASS